MTLSDGTASPHIDPIFSEEHESFEFQEGVEIGGAIVRAGKSGIHFIEFLDRDGKSIKELNPRGRTEGEHERFHKMERMKP